MFCCDRLLIAVQRASGDDCRHASRPHHSIPYDMCVDCQLALCAGVISTSHCLCPHICTTCITVHDPASPHTSHARHAHTLCPHGPHPPSVHTTTAIHRPPHAVTHGSPSPTVSHRLGRIGGPLSSWFCICLRVWFEWERCNANHAPETQ